MPSSSVIPSLSCNTGRSEAQNSRTTSSASTRPPGTKSRALAYACESPVLVIAHPGIDGGVFDHGITGEGVLHIDLAEPDWFRKAQFTQPFREWAAEVQVCSNRRSGSAEAIAAPDRRGT